MEPKDNKIPVQNPTDKPKERMKVSEAPLVSLVPIPSLALDDVEVDFQKDIDDSESSPKKGDVDKDDSPE